MKTLLSILSMLVIAFTPSLAGDPVNEKCPTSGKPVDKAHTSTYKKEISFCCEKCKAKFDKDPASFIEKIAAYDAKAGKCIISGEAVDAAQKSTYETTVGFCCPKCKTGFDKAPDTQIVKVVKK